MRNKTYIATILILGATLMVAPAFAQDAPAASGFSQTKLVSLAPGRAGDKACLNLEATFSAPLQQKPSATLDLQRSDLLEGVVSFILNVVPLGQKRYSLTMETSDPQRCEELRKSVGKITVTLDGAVGPDGRSLLPEEKTFAPHRLFGR